MNNNFENYQQVVLSKALPEYDLQKGDVATIVETMEHNGKTGYCLEIFDSSGNTLDVIVVNESDIAPVMPNAIVNYREFHTL